MKRELYIHPEVQKPSSPYLFGHNLEHTRACVTGGLSAQMLRNRKFAGRPQARLGLAAEWFGIGERTYFRCEGGGYVRHWRDNGMRRQNEINGQIVQNPIEGQAAGIGQAGLRLGRGARYTVAVAAKCASPVDLTVSLGDRPGGPVYAETEIALEPGDWKRYEVTLNCDTDDEDGCLNLRFTERAQVVFGAVSMLPEGHFHGMRRDAVDALKEIGPGMLRWPGGNFAGEYRWRDMLLPVDMRAPLQAFMEHETQPYSHGYDMHEIDTDDFIALCREVGAEPFITINLAWDSPEECAAGVEYCNGPADSPCGKLRAERGHAEPYGVKYWSLGNEMGYGHMEGPMRPEKYAEQALAAAKAMLSVTPGLQLCGSGAYYGTESARLWLEKSAKALAPAAEYISFHTYNGVHYDCTSPEGMKAAYEEAMEAVEGNARAVRALREMMPDCLHISFDEWNIWASWYAKANALDGLYAAGMLHAMLSEAGELDVPIMCYFQPVNEGAIELLPEGAKLRAPGQAFALLKAHKGAKLCRVRPAGPRGGGLSAGRRTVCLPAERGVRPAPDGVPEPLRRAVGREAAHGGGPAAGLPV